jgi:histidinol-phosphate/aromatic aminotransferase/cobyric acid decarboxylase-like protein
MRHVCTTTRTLREDFITKLQTLGLSVSVSHTNFALIHFGNANAAASANRTLRAEGIALRAQTGGLSHCLRATIAGEPDMERVIECLAAWLRSTPQ